MKPYAKPYADLKRYAALFVGGAALALAALGTTAATAHADPRPAMAWSGDVDDTTLIYFHNRDVRTRDVSGKASTQTSAQVFDRLPRGPIRVFLTEHAGRGQVRVVQQPTPDNDFTAAVRIHDPQAGRGHYDIALAWAALPAPYGGYGSGRVFRGAVGGPYGGSYDGSYGGSYDGYGRDRR